MIYRSPEERLDELERRVTALELKGQPHAHDWQPNSSSPSGFTHYTCSICGCFIKKGEVPHA